MAAKKEQLELQVAQLEADLKDVRLSQEKNNSPVDDTRLGQIESSINEVRDWIKTAKVTEELNKKYNPERTTAPKSASTSDVIAEIDSAVQKTEK